MRALLFQTRHSIVSQISLIPQYSSPCPTSAPKPLTLRQSMQPWYILAFSFLSLVFRGFHCFNQLRASCVLHGPVSTARLISGGHKIGTQKGRRYKYSFDISFQCSDKDKHCDSLASFIAQASAALIRPHNEFCFSEMHLN
jgi:hypothetical protein